MDWSNEPYVRVYTRETDDDMALSWEAMALWNQLMKRFDRSGFVETRRGARGVAAMTRIPVAVVERVLPELLEDGRLVAVEGGFLAPNFIAAQEATKSDRQRQKDSRDRRRAHALDVTKRDGAVTFRDASVTNHDASVTNGHDASRAVTLTSADQGRADPLPVTHTHARERNPDAGRIARRVWDHAAKVCGELSLAKIKPLQIWPTMAGGDHPGWQQLLDRICELLVDQTPERAEEVARNRVDVAKAKAIDDGDGQWFSPTAMFSANSFAHWSPLDPLAIGRKRAGPQRAAGALIGAATPRTDHPESQTLKPFGEL